MRFWLWWLGVDDDDDDVGGVLECVCVLSDGKKGNVLDGTR